MTLDDVDAFATGLPDVVVGTKWRNRTWMVGDRGFAWQRPFSKADLKRFGDEAPPAGDILAVAVESLDAKDALLAIAPRGFFTIPHFNGYPALLIALRTAHAKDVRAALLDAWRTVAPPASIAKRGAARRSPRSPVPTSPARRRSVSDSRVPSARPQARRQSRPAAGRRERVRRQRSTTSRPRSASR